MKVLLTTDRIRAALDDARTEKDVELSLRAHKIRFSYDTCAGFLAFRIPTRSGSVLVYRTASRSAPFSVRFDSVSGSVSTVSAFPSSPFPIPRFRTFD